MSLRRRLSVAARRLGWRPAALDWRRGEPAAEPAQSDGAVEVVVPIHGAHEVARACLRSVARHTDLDRHALTVVVDGDPEFEDQDVRTALDRPDARLKILRHDQARGFVASVNQAMAESDLDVVLVNSDVVVTDRWLDQMLEAAASATDQKVATVTPFSNDATICSVPEPLRANALPPHHDIDSLARLVARVSGRSRPRLPTGVGMCLLIRRAALDELGLFDEAAFGTGYGEETDFCFRALKAGWIHLLDDATFVFHHGRQSFGAARNERVRRAERVLARRYPAYRATLDEYLRHDLLGHGPTADAVRRIRWEIRTRSPSDRFHADAARVLHLVHGWPPEDRGGTENYCHWLVEDQRRHRQVAVYTRVADPELRFGDAFEELDEGLRVRRIVNNFTARNPIVRNALDSPKLRRDFVRFLDDFGPDLVHVHHLAGHALTLPREIHERRLPLVFQLQDWWALCARANLLRQPQGSVCPGPTLARCSACLPLTKIAPAALWNRALYSLRGHLAAGALRRADAYVMGSRAIRADYLERELVRPGDPVYVLPYGVEPPRNVPERAATRTPIRFGIVGAVLPHKGIHVVVEALAGVDRALLDVWGNDGADAEYVRRLRHLAPADRVRLRGSFDENEKAEVFRAMDVLLLPSLGKESFGLVAREALAHGVPVVASRLGALGELFVDYPDGRLPGALLPAGDVRVWRELLQGLAERPQEVDRWRRNLGAVRTTVEHAEQIEHVYADVLERRRKQGRRADQG